jgi:hypothetical protein
LLIAVAGFVVAVRGFLIDVGGLLIDAIGSLVEVLVSGLEVGGSADYGRELRRSGPELLDCLIGWTDAEPVFPNTSAVRGFP